MRFPHRVSEGMRCWQGVAVVILPEKVRTPFRKLTEALSVSSSRRQSELPCSNRRDGDGAPQLSKHMHPWRRSKTERRKDPTYTAHFMTIDLLANFVVSRGIAIVSDFIKTRNSNPAG
jgi:hypothetical protein